ncbi:hypothetical protein NDA16_003307 [Ustilago loliicola]|nr:hypothetical protein NDA16_003307 [Ustilago loliicola]
MSFFGFDVSLPGDKRAGGGVGSGNRNRNRNRNRNPNPNYLQNAFDPTFDNEESLDAKVNALAAGAQEDVEIYTWGQEGYDGLGDRLDESNDDLNEDTFGDVHVGKDFDFGNGASAQPSQQQQYAYNQQQQYSQQPPKSKFDPSNKFAASLDDFLVDPVPRFGAGRGAQQQQQQQPRAQPKTLEEVEAEMLAMRAKQQQQQQQQQQQLPAPQGSQPPTDRKPMTVEEVEAELRARRAAGPGGAGAGAVPPPPPMHAGPPGQSMGPPPAMAALMQSHQRTDSRDGQQPPPGMPPMPPSAPMLPPLPPNADPATVQAAQQAAQAAHSARMRSLLEAMPPLVQQSILSLPPPMQFDSLESVAANFPTLLDPSSRERAPSAEQDAVRFMMEKAQHQMAEFERVEAKRKRRMEKINSMAKYNGLMSGSDKDFITRIQISQLITADPYADDFYAHIYFAHIYFALRGGPRRPGMPLLPPPAASAAANNGASAKAGKGKHKLNKQQNAMLRMQQQVERIVQSRKERIEKSASGAALEGALGRVSLSSTKNPRQMLQISADAAKANKERGASGDATPDAGHARNAVRQALEGASLGGNGNAGLRRDPLTKHEVLRILEKLYDLVLQLEQLRRNAPPAPPSEVVDPQDEAAVSAKEAYDLHQLEQASVTSTLWTELRVLEPLEISDPHPFVSLLSSAKGKRLLPRALRHLSSEQTLTALTMVVASFESLDVVRDGPLLDDLSDDPGKIEARRDAERQSETFATTIVPSMMQMASSAPMRIVSGMLALFVERNDPVRVTQTRPGVAFLTIFLSRAETLRQQAEVPADELEQFKQIFALLFSRLTAQGKLATLFPSTRTKLSLPFGVSYYMGSGLGQQVSAQTVGGKYRNVDLEDEPSWNLMAALAVSSTMEQQQVLVQELRDKILENVISAKEWQKRNGGAGGEEIDIRIRNVNLLLHALNLDAAQISV